MRKNLLNSILGFAMVISSMSSAVVLADSGKDLLRFKASISSNAAMDAQVKSIISKYYQTLASGNCSTLHEMIDDPANFVSEKELCRFWGTKFFSFIRKYYLKDLEVQGQVSEGNGIYFFPYEITARKKTLAQVVQDQRNTSEFPKILQEFRQVTVTESAKSSNSQTEPAHLILIDKNTAKIESASLSYKEIKEPFFSLIKLSTDLKTNYSSDKPDLKSQKEKWQQVKTNIDQIQRYLFSVDWDLGGMPLLMALQLDSQIQEFKELAKAQHVNVDSIHYCYELAQL